MANDDTLIALSFLHPRSAKEFEADVGPATTGAQALTGLIDAGFLDKQDPTNPYALQLGRTGATLVLGQPLVAQGAADGDRIQVILTDRGGARAGEDLRSRLALDWRALTGLAGPMVRSVRGYADSLARGRGRALADADGKTWLATQYLVEIERPMLAAPGVPLGAATLLLDTTAALARGYPLADPSVFVVSQPLPFTHRVHRPSGSVCIGRAWQKARGRILLAHLVVHVLRLLGFDEPQNGDSGYDPTAYHYWIDTLGGKPLPCAVPYPALPADVTHGTATAPMAEAVALFKPRGTGHSVAVTPVIFRAAGVRS